MPRDVQTVPNPSQRTNRVRTLLGLPPLPSQASPANAGTSAGVEPAVSPMQVAPGGPPRVAPPMTPTGHPEWPVTAGLQQEEAWIAEELAAVAGEQARSDLPVSPPASQTSKSMASSPFPQQRLPPDQPERTLEQQRSSNQVPVQPVGQTDDSPGELDTRATAVPSSATVLTAVPTAREGVETDELAPVVVQQPAPAGNLTTVEIPGQVSERSAAKSADTESPARYQTESVPETAGTTAQPLPKPAPKSAPKPAQKTGRVADAGSSPVIPTPSIATSSIATSSIATSSIATSSSGPKPTPAVVPVQHHPGQPTQGAAQEPLQRVSATTGAVPHAQDASMQPPPPMPPHPPAVDDQDGVPVESNEARAGATADVRSVQPVSQLRPASWQTLSPQPVEQEQPLRGETEGTQRVSAQSAVAQERPFAGLEPSRPEQRTWPNRSSESPSNGEASRLVQALRKQVDALTAKVADLENAQQSAPPPAQPTVIVRNRRVPHTTETRAFWARSYRGRAHLRI